MISFAGSEPGSSVRVSDSISAIEERESPTQRYMLALGPRKTSLQPYTFA